MSNRGLADRIRKLRGQRSWTQAHLATAANVNLRTVQRLETTGACSPETLLSVASAFEVDVMELTALRVQNKGGGMNLHKGLENLTDLFSGSRPGKQRILIAGVLYLVLLLGFGTITALSWGELYRNQPPTIRLANMSEDEVIRVYDAEYNAEYDSYRSYFRPFLLGLALYLAVWSAIFGLWAGKWLLGLLALAGGGAVTVLVLSLLPWMYFPFDQYPLASLWVIGNLLTMLICWLLVTVFGRLLIADKSVSPA